MTSALRSCLLLLALPSCMLMDPLSGEYSVAVDSVCAGQWSHTYGNAQGLSVGGLARDTDKLYAVGAFTAKLTFSSEVEAKDRDAFVAKLDGDGALELAAASGVVGQENPSAVAGAASGAVFAGAFGSDYQGCQASLEQGIFVTRVAPSLTLQTSCIAATGEIEVTGVAVDASSTIARVVGSVQGELAGVPSDERDGFIVSVDLATGQLVGTPLLIGGAGEQLVHGIASAEAGGFWVAGGFSVELRVGAESRTSVGGSDMFLASFDSQSLLTELATWGDDGDQEATAVGIDGGRLFLTGELDGGELLLGSVVVPAPGDEAVAGFVAAFELSSPLPAPSWVTQFHAEDLDVSRVSATHGTRPSAFVGGTVWGTLNLGETRIRGRDSDMFVLRLDRETGDPLASSRCGDADEQPLAGMVTDPIDDTVFFATTLRGSIDLGGVQKHTSHGNGDLLIGELAAP